MILGLIGMSGVGKSRWTQRFAAARWHTIDCDQQIANRLRGHVEIGSGTVYDLGRWMGFPTDSQYAEREATYLAHEHAVVHQALRWLDTAACPQSIVLDLTGSVVYLNSALLSELRQAVTLVYLKVSAERRSVLLAEYLRMPRPVVWHGVLQAKPGETTDEAFARCYPQLLAYREQRYAALSHITLVEEQYQNPAFGVEELLALL